MELIIKCKIGVLVCCIYFFSVQSTPLQDHRENSHLTDLTVKSSDNIFSSDASKSVVKRSADWSRRISSSSNPHDSSHVAEGSENVEITSKAPRIIRRMRIHNGVPYKNQSQDVVEYREILPNTRTTNGAGKIVRVKKFRRKPIRKTTVEPETTTRMTTTTTKNPYTVNPKITPDTQYTHITVINKEVRNPKLNKKHKRKRPRNQLVPTSPYDSETKQNAYYRVTVPPERSSYPDNERYYTGRRSAVSRNRQRESPSETELIKIQNNNPSLQEKRVVYEPIRARASQPNAINVPREDNAPEKIPELNNMKSQRLTVASSAKRALLNSQQKDDTNIPKKVTTEAPPKVDSTQTSKDLPVTDPTVLNLNTALMPIDERVANKSNADIANLEAVPHPRHPENPNPGNILPGRQRFPSRFPSFLYDEQDGFADPFFHSHGIHTPLDRSQQEEPLMPPTWSQPFSPIYVPNNPHRSDHIFANGPQTYQPDQLMAPVFNSVLN